VNFSLYHLKHNVS
jgi:hypothetical protein